MAVVQPQPVFSNPFEPGERAMRAAEFGAGLRQRFDAAKREKILQARQDAEFERQQQIRSLFGEGKVDEAKGLMSLQEREQLVNIQGSALNNEIKKLELDRQGQAIRDAAGFIGRATKLDPTKDTFESERNALITEAAPVASMNPQVAAALTNTVKAKEQERNTLLKKVANEARADFLEITGQDIPIAEKITKINKWQSDYDEAFSGPFAKELLDLKDRFMDDARREALINRPLATRAGSAFERVLSGLVESGEVSPEEAAEINRKFLTVATTPRTSGNSTEAIIQALIGGQPAATPAPVPAAQRYTRDQLINAVRAGQLSKDEAKRIAREQGIQ